MPDHNCEFHLFRLTLHPTAPLFSNLADKPRLLHAAVLERPFGPWGRTHWAVGNTSTIDDGAIYFRIYRAGKMLVAQPDQRGDIVEKEVEAAPNTHVLIDLTNQVCAIAAAPRLAGKPDSIARGLERLLNSTDALRDNYAEARASAIKDPQDFIQRLRAAHRAHTLWVEERRPNPIDVKGLAKSLSATVESFRAEKVRAQWRGEALDASSQEVEDLVRATNIAGGDAGARIQETDRSRGSIAISLASKFAKFRFTADFEDPNGLKGLLSEVRERYRRLRDRE